MKITALVLFVLVLLSCNDAKKDGQNSNSESDVELIEGYFPKNNIEFSQPIKVITIANKQDFDSYFGVAKTMTNNISKIDFDKNKVVALIARPSNKEQTINIIETKLKNNKLAINYKLEIGESQSFSSSDLKMFKVPKSVYALDVYSDEGNKLPKAEN